MPSWGLLACVSRWTVNCARRSSLAAVCRTLSTISRTLSSIHIQEVGGPFHIEISTGRDSFGDGAKFTLTPLPLKFPISDFSLARKPAEKNCVKRKLVLLHGNGGAIVLRGCGYEQMLYFARVSLIPFCKRPDRHIMPQTDLVPNRLADEDDSSGSIKVVHRALRVLEVLATAETPLTLTEIAKRSDLHPSTALRILRTLAEGGYIVGRSKPPTWTLGPAILRLQSGPRFSNVVGEIVLPYMRRLCRETGHTVHLAQLIEDEVCYTEKVDPPEQEVLIKSKIGGRRPIYATALGKILASGLPATELHNLSGRLQMTSFTPNTITTPDAFLAEIEKVAAQGYAVDDHELSAALVCVAAPIRDAKGDVIFAISVSTVGVHNGSEQFALINRATIEAARDISEALGHKASLRPAASP